MGVMRRAHVMGLGRSGLSAARLLHQEGWHVTASDSSQSDALQQAKRELEVYGIAVELGSRLQPDPAQMDRVVVSPGVPWDLSALVEAKAMGIEVMGEMELAWRSLSTYPWVGITGTNGKTTTTALIAAIFKRLGFMRPLAATLAMRPVTLLSIPSIPLPLFLLSRPLPLSTG